MSSSYQLAPLHRRILAMIYDFFIAGAFITIITAILSYILILLKIQSLGLDTAELEKNKSVITVFEPGSSLTISVFTMQLMFFFIYLVFFWLRSGKTPGAWVWKIQNLSQDYRGMTLLQAVIRYMVLLIMLCGSFVIANQGFDLSTMQSVSIMLLSFTFIVLWSRFNKTGLMLHEEMSKTIGIDLR